MLVLTRKIDQTIVIDGTITVQVLGIQGNKVRLGIVAPGDVRVDREEVARRREEFAADGPAISARHSVIA
jgi:carbon storage regulator